MKRNLALFSALALAGCAASAPYRVPYRAPEALGPSPYASIPRAGVHDELLSCNGGAGSNLGPIGARGEVKLYTPYIFTEAGALLRNPTEQACLSSGFGWRGTADGGEREHTGLDLANPDGGYIHAAGEGLVTFAGWSGGYGNLLVIDHGQGVRTLYAHLSEIDPNLAPGVVVSAGAAIARMGATGNATGIHLHFELRVDGLAVDPLAYGAEALS
jgi:murein DD-endopeptidase MepM/ murein hydrolase activator NlpD